MWLCVWFETEKQSSLHVATPFKTQPNSKRKYYIFHFSSIIVSNGNGFPFQWTLIAQITDDINFQANTIRIEFVSRAFVLFGFFFFVFEDG